MAFERRYEGNDRRKYSTFRLLFVLQFGKYKDIMEVKDNGEIRIHSIAKLARKVHMRPIRLREALEWLHTAGYLTSYESMTQGLGCIIKLAQPTNIIIQPVRVTG